ncbi:odorant receptor 131-2-like [Notolabrus celidotus]|uniref:odorant receptor 131-2-like n=1 Tax=Notolabrus celidotus TaxID=1203425 RepID=UPI00148F835B|nr:odorant receptor 131-2-like [Notolabrus celidotus]
MAGNNSSVSAALLVRIMTTNLVSVVQPLVLIFLSINISLIITFFQKECFNTTARYILFAVTLLSDSVLLIISDILLLLQYLGLTMEIRFCIIICSVVLHYVILTPVTLTTMTLERYVAICMPLHHAELCSTRSTMRCILIINGLSIVPCIIFLSLIFAFAPLSFYFQYKVCVVSVVLVYSWHDYVRSGLYQFYFLIMCIIIVFSYIKIMRVAKAASGESKKSTGKGLRTVALHAFQLLLCLIQLWFPFIEANVLQIHFKSFLNVRFFNYVIFFLAPRCLSPLIYGLRDEMFFHALKCNFFCGLYKKSPANGL